MTEQQFQNQVVALAIAMGLLVYHTHDSRRSQPGFPDLVIVGAKGVLYRELKTEIGKVSPEQERWIVSLVTAGQDAGVWRPSDWPARVQSELAALGRCPIEAPRPTAAQLRAQLQRRAGSGARKGPKLT